MLSCIRIVFSGTFFAIGGGGGGHITKGGLFEMESLIGIHPKFIFQ